MEINENSITQENLDYLSKYLNKEDLEFITQKNEILKEPINNSTVEGLRQLNIDDKNRKVMYQQIVDYSHSANAHEDYKREGEKPNIVSNLNKLNEEEIGQYFNFFDDMKVSLNSLSVVNDPKKIIDTKEQEYTKAAYKERVENESRIIDAALTGDEEAIAKSINENYVNYKKTAFTVEQNYIALKYKDEIESSFGNQKYALIAREQRDLYQTFTKNPDVPVSFCINSTTAMGQVPENETTYGFFSKNLGFGSEAKYDEHNRPVMTIALVDRSKLTETKWDNLGLQVEDYLESLRVNDSKKFDRIVGPEISKLGENWKGEFEKQIFNPIKEHVPNEYGHDKLTGKQNDLYQIVLEPVFGVNKYYTGVGISSNVDIGYGGFAERVYPSKGNVLLKKESAFFKSSEEAVEVFDKNNKKGVEQLNQSKDYINAIEKSGVVFSVDICQKDHGYVEISGKDVVIYEKQINKAREKNNAIEKRMNEKIREKENEKLQKQADKDIKEPQLKNTKTDKNLNRVRESYARER